jgi:carboxylesterase
LRIFLPGETGISQFPALPGLSFSGGIKLSEINPAFQNPQLERGPLFFSGGPVGILLIHGYTATVAEVRLLAEFFAAQGYTVSCPLLPGHGTSIEDLHTCTWQDWQQTVEAAYKELTLSCKVRFAGGSSLGSLLSLELGLHYPSLAGLLLYAPNLIMGNRLATVTPVARYFIKSISKHRGLSDKSIVDQRWAGYTRDSVPAIAQMLSLEHQLRHQLHRIINPVIIFQGKKDESVNPNGAQIIYDQVSSACKQLIWLDHSSHCLLIDREWESVAAQSLEFIQVNAQVPCTNGQNHHDEG